MADEKQLIVIDPKEYGLEQNEAKQVEAVFTPMIAKMTELEDEFNEIVALPVEPDTCKKAKELRLKYVKIRTATADIHKKAKAYYLAGSRFVDGWRNAQQFASANKEDALMQIEKHFELLEQAAREKLGNERSAALAPYVDDVSCYNLAEMSQQGFDQLLESSKIACEAKAKAEKEAEDARLEAEKKEREEQERIRKENEQLKKDAEAKDAEIAAIKKKEADDAEAEKAKADADARLEKEASYKEFLKKNGCNDETKHLYHIEKSGNEIKLYRIVDTFVVE